MFVVRDPDFLSTIHGVLKPSNTDEHTNLLNRKYSNASAKVAYRQPSDFIFCRVALVVTWKTKWRHSNKDFQWVSITNSLLYSIAVEKLANRPFKKNNNNKIKKETKKPPKKYLVKRKINLEFHKNENFEIVTSWNTEANFLPRDIEFLSQNNCFLLLCKKFFTDFSLYI